MITKIFVMAAVLLGVLFLTSIYLVFRSSEVPIPIEDAGRQGVPSLKAPSSSITMGTPEFYMEVMRQSATALKTYEEARGQAYRVDLTQADGGLRAVLNQITFALPVDQSVFWRLVHGDKGLVLCGQYLKKSEVETLAVVLREAAKQAPAVEQSGPCGPEAFGIQLTGAAPVTTAPPGLPQLPSGPGLPPPVAGGAASAGGPAVATAACAVPNPALEERLLRLL